MLKPHIMYKRNLVLDFFSQRNLFLSPRVLGLLMVIMFCGYGATVHAANSSLFTETQLNLPFNLTQPVISAEILPLPGKELIVIGVTNEGQGQVAIYAFDSQTSGPFLIDLITIDKTIFAIDVGVVQPVGLQTLYLLGRDTLYRYQFGSLKQMTQRSQGESMADDSRTNEPIFAGTTDYLLGSELVAIQSVETMYLAEQANALFTFDFVKDINNDHLDDVVLPHFEKVNLWLSGQTKLRHQTLPIGTLLDVDNQNIQYKAKKLHFADMDQDGLNDIVLVETEQLQVFKQQKDGLFMSDAFSISLAAGIEGIDWWDKVEDDGQSLDQSQLHHRKVAVIDDVNGDGLPDLVVVFTQSSGVLDRSNDYEFFYGQVEKQKLIYDVEPSTFIRSDSTLSDLKLVDLDQDGQLEIMLSAFDLGVSQIISALLSSSIDQEMLIFKMDEKQQFGTKPAVAQDVEMTFSLSSGRAGEPMVKVEDVNGDALPDLIFSDGEEQIKVMLASTDSKRIFNRRAEKFKVKLPKNAKSITHSDLNNDGKIDLIMHYTRADSVELLNKVVVLIAN